MNLLSRDSETICALSTPPGHGGVAVVRVSGKNALSVSKKIALFLPDKPESHKIYFGRLKSESQNSEFDEALVSYFAKGRSYTGEETIEISTHGSPVITNLLLDELVMAGCRPADRGEFTYRAFMNGNLDLVQAEAVLNLIESQSRRAALVANRQLRGHLSTTFLKMEDRIVNVMANLEADIDFSTEDIDPYDQNMLSAQIDELGQQVAEILKTQRQGRLLSEGFRVALVGPPNAGKSSLLNRILSQDRAIVSSEAGTTRDVVTGESLVGGIKIQWVDTAGIHQTKNEVESIGIKKSLDEIQQSDLVLLLVDASVCSSEDEFRLSATQFIEKYVSNEVPEKIAIIFNKSDLCLWQNSEVNADKLGCSDLRTENQFFVSAKTGEGLNRLLEYISGLVAADQFEDENLVVSARQIEGLEKIQKALEKTRTALAEKSSPEFVVFEMQEAVLAIHGLLGKEYDDQVMDRVFSGFCIGK